MARKGKNTFVPDMGRIIPTYDIYTIKHDQFASNDVMVDRFAPYLKMRSLLCKPHRHRFYHLIYFTQGNGSQTIDFVNFAVQSGQIYFMIPGQVHHWNFDGPVDGYVINFSEDYYRSFLLDHRFLERFSFFTGVAADGVVFFNDAQQKEMIALFEKMIATKLAGGEFNELYVKLLILEVFVLSERYRGAAEEHKKVSRSNALVKQFQNLIDQKYLQLRLPKDYAALLFVTPVHLNSLCVKFMGISAGEMIRKRILLEAKRLLVNAGITISQIAYQLNFTDHAHFSKFFKKETGESPDEFRKKQMSIA